jgi:hypothetical protein
VIDSAEPDDNVYAVTQTILKTRGDKVLITSQSFRDEAIIAEKRAAKDYEITVSPKFEIDGDVYRVLIDGHHSFEAARLDGVEPECREATSQDHDAIGLLERGDIAGFLDALYHGEDYRDAYTGKFAF